jgi:hypothetical protein
LSDAEAEGVVRALRRGLDAEPTGRPTSPSALVEEIRAGATTLMPPPTTTDLLPVKKAGTPFPSRPAPTTTDLSPLKEPGTALPSRPAPTTADLWAFAALRVRSRPVEKETIPLHPVPTGNAEAGPERSRLERAARSSRLRGGLAAVLVLLVGATLLQVRSARADRNQFRRLQLASVAQALAARVDGELTAGRHERAALLARQADLFDRQTGATAAPEVKQALRAALTAPHFSRVVARAKGGVWSVALNPDGTKLATAGSAVRLLDLRVPNEPAVALSGHIGAIASMAFSPDGKTLATGGDDPTARLWDLSRPGAAPARLEGHTDRLTSLAFGFAGQRLATASRDGTVRLWDLGTTPPAASVLSGHTGPVTAVAFSADGARLATAGIDGQVRIWDVAQPAAVATLPTGAGVAAVAFSPDGRYLATGGDDRLVRLWDLSQPGATPRVLAGHGGPVSTVAFSADGNSLASGSEDKTVRLWPLAGETPDVLTGHTGPVSSVAFSPDGETLASASADGTARLWQLGEPDAARALRANPDVDNAVLANLVCQEVGRNLTQPEWREFVGPGVDYRRTCPPLPAG